MFKGIYPGMFDPPTLGHLAMIHRCSKLFDHLTVAIGESLQKCSPLLTTNERLEFLMKETKGLSNVSVVTFSGLVADFAKKQGAHTLVRGLRSSSDFDYENQMAQVNKDYGVDTLFLMADPKLSCISSTLIKEIASNGGSLEGYLPKGLEGQIQTHYQRENNGKRNC